MLDGNQRSAWTQTANVICTLLNVNRGKGAPVRFEDVYPFSSPQRPEEELVVDLEGMERAWKAATGG